MHSILIPMAEGQASMAALRKARGLAQKQHLRLYLLHIVEPKETGDILGRATGAATHAMDNEVVARAEALLEAWWDRLNEPMAAVDFVIKGGKVSEAILEEAQRLGVDTIILGTSKTSPKWEGTLGKIQKATSCQLTVVNENEQVVLEHAP